MKVTAADDTQSITYADLADGALFLWRSDYEHVRKAGRAIRLYEANIKSCTINGTRGWVELDCGDAHRAYTCDSSRQVVQVNPVETPY